MPVRRARPCVLADCVDVVQGEVGALVAVLLHDLRDFVHDRRVCNEVPEAARLDDVRATQAR